VNRNLPFVYINQYLIGNLCYHFLKYRGGVTMFSLLPLPISPIKPSSAAIAPAPSGAASVADTTTSAPQSSASALPPVTAPKSSAETTGAALFPLGGGDIAARGTVARAMMDADSVPVAKRAAAETMTSASDARPKPTEVQPQQNADEIAQARAESLVNVEKLRRPAAAETLGAAVKAPSAPAEAAQSLRQSQRTDPAPEPKLMLSL
jgi:hypothetical protein